jgi:AcrR family transcriptional regulator
MGTLERRMATGVRSDDQPDLRAETRRNRDRILPAGVQCISLARPSRKIAKIAGIRGGTLYRRFQSREALLAAALQGKQGGTPRAFGKRTRMGLTTANPTKRNSVVSSIAQMSERLLKMLRKSGDFQTEYGESDRSLSIIEIAEWQ